MHGLSLVLVNVLLLLSECFLLWPKSGQIQNNRCFRLASLLCVPNSLITKRDGNKF